MGAHIIAISIQKGGTGKTTTAAALAQAAAIRGQKALAIDLDPQSNLSFALDADTGRPGALETMRPMKRIGEAQETGGAENADRESGGREPWSYILKRRQDGGLQ